MSTWIKISILLCATLVQITSCNMNQHTSGEDGEHAFTNNLINVWIVRSPISHESDQQSCYSKQKSQIIEIIRCPIFS